MNDLEVIVNRIRGDPWILQVMGLASAPQSAIDERIAPRRTNNKSLKAKDKYINIYYGPSRKLRNSSFLDTIVQIDVLVGAGLSSIANEIMEQIEALLYEYKVNGKMLDKDSDIVEIPAGSNNFYSCSMRFNFPKAKGIPRLKTLERK